jgi:hypothetical protein
MERESLRTDTHFEAIRLGAEFLRSHAHAPGNRIYFCLSETGQVRAAHRQAPSRAATPHPRLGAFSPSS